MSEFAVIAKTPVSSAKPDIRQDIVAPDNARKSSLPERDSSCACGGGCPSCEKKPNPIKTERLEVSQPGDAAEIEADAIADSIMQMSAEKPALAIARPAQKSESPEAPFDEQPEEQEEKAGLQKEAKVYAAPPDPPPEGELPTIKNAINTGGRPLEPGIRSFFEKRFGTSLSHVRIHTDSKARQSAGRIKARAYTLGHNIVFGNGEYRPADESGKWLLAHELAHVVGNHSSRNAAGPTKIHRAPPNNQPEVKPAPETPQTPQQQSPSITVNVILDKDCTSMSAADFRTFVMQLLLSQVFGFDYMTSVGEVTKYHYDFSKFNDGASRASGTKVPIIVFKDFYREVLQHKYGAADPRIETLVQTNFGSSTSTASVEDMKQSTKLILLEDIKTQLTPLEIEFLKEKLKWRTGNVDEALETYRKMTKNIEQYKKSLGWYSFLKKKLSAVEYYRTVTTDFLKTERVFHLIYTRQALAIQSDPMVFYYKSNMAEVYAQYPWLKDVEAQLQEDYRLYPSRADGEGLINRELELAGFKTADEYEEFLKIFVGSFYGVVAYKISQQLDVNEEIVNKEKKYYTEQGTAPFAAAFGSFKAEYDQIDKESAENRSRFSNLGDGTLKYNEKVEELKAREAGIDQRVNKVREDNKAGFPILEDKDLTNRNLTQLDSTALQKRLLSITETRLGYIKTTRGNLASKPEKFVTQIANGKYLQLAKEEIGLDPSSFESLVIEGRINKVQMDAALERTALIALSIGLALVTLPLSGTAAAIAAIPGFALGVYTSVEEYKEYKLKKAAAGTSFSSADAISNDDPSLVWLVIGLAGTALEGIILVKTFATLSKSRYLKYGLPEEEFVNEVEQVLRKEAPDISQAKLDKLLQKVEDKVEEAKALKGKFDEALEKFNKKEVPNPNVVQLNMVLLPIPPHKVDAVLEMMYWAIRRGINKFDQFLLESKIASVERQLLESVFTKALAKFQGKTSLSNSDYQDFIVEMYKDFGYEVKDVFVRNKVTGTGAHLKALKKPDGSFEFLEMEGMTSQAQEIIGDMKAGGKDLQLGAKEAEKIKDFSKVRSVGAPVKLLSDLPNINAILTDVEKILEPVTEYRRSARQLSADISRLRAQSGNATDISRLEAMLAESQKKLSGTGSQLAAKADDLEKEALLITDAEQKRKMLQRITALREEAQLLKYNIKVQDAFNLRSNLRKILRTSELFGDNAIYYNAHHILPVEMIEESAVLRKAIEGGFDFNGAVNGINLSQFSSKFRTENIIIEFIQDGKKAKITMNGSVLGEADVVSKGGGVSSFKIADKEVGSLTYTKEIKTDGRILEGGTVEMTDASGTVKQTLQESPFGSHASHPNYSLEIKKRLDAIDAKYPTGLDNKTAAQEVGTLVKEIKDKIIASMNTPGFKIDNLFK